MSDWSEKVEALELECGILFSDEQYDAIADALRAAEKRGRVAGLREAEQKALWYDGSLHGLALELRSMADKLEAETP